MLLHSFSAGLPGESTKFAVSMNAVVGGSQPIRDLDDQTGLTSRRRPGCLRYRLCQDRNGINGYVNPTKMFRCTF